MRIALDYDSTYTADPILWEAFIKNASQRGHEVMCVTWRSGNTPTNISCPTIYTNRKAKKPFVQALGIYFDVWIDDNPEAILFDLN